MLFESPRAFLRALPRFAQDANGIEILSSTADFRIRLLEQIAQATTRIYIAALYLQNDEGG
ncbi:MAG: CDP-diacylglycerol--serine O-phosphatidyltransferase, partial [Deefgea sp.]